MDVKNCVICKGNIPQKTKLLFLKTKYCSQKCRKRSRNKTFKGVQTNCYYCNNTVEDALKTLNGKHVCEICSDIGERLNKNFTREEYTRLFSVLAKKLYKQQ